MKKLFIKSNIVVSFLAVLSVISFIIVENTMTYVKQDHFDEKLQASEKTKEAVNFLKDYRMKNVLYIDDINDPNETGIIGQKYSQITTESSSLPVKLSATNPNFSALAVQLLKEADVKKNDHIAICMSGSFPALNLAVLSAAEVLELNSTVIISATSSSWGANDPEFTFPDMVKKLKDNDYFENSEIEYVSTGGVEDMGMSLSKKGRSLILEAIERNSFILLNKGDLKANINERIRLFEEYSGEKPIKVFINIGGGVASIGSTNNGLSIPAGLNTDIKLRQFPDKIGVMYEMAKKDIPIIHFENLEKLMKKYDLPINPVPMPEIGSGELYFVFKYNMKIVTIITVTLFLFISFFVYIDRKNHKLGNDIISDEIQI